VKKEEVEEAKGAEEQGHDDPSRQDQMCVAMLVLASALQEQMNKAGKTARLQVEQ
jgi:hypothetical protein